MFKKKTNTAVPQKSRRPSRRVRRGSYAALASLILLAVLVLLNVVVGQLPTRYTRADLTATGLYTIGEQTKSIVSELDMPVTIYWLVTEGSEDATIEELLGRYTDLSDQLTVQRIDPNVYPNFIGAYTQGNVYQNSLVVESQLRYKFINYTSIYVTEYEYTSDYSSYTTSTTFEGEGELTSALDYVTSADLPVVYYLTGHGEPGLATSLQQSVTEQNITVNELSLFTEASMPENCAALIIDSPSNDLYEGEAEMILDYMQAGGKVVLLTNYGADAMPNLQKITDAWGLALQEGAVIENDRNSYYQYPYVLLPTVKSHTITSSLYSQGGYILYYLAQGIVTDEDALPNTASVTRLLTSSSDSFSQADLENAVELTQSEADPVGPFDLAVLMEDSDTGAALVWYTTGNLLNAQLDSWVAGNNSTLFVNTLGYLADHESAISIAGKSISSGSVMLSSAAIGLWKTVYTMLLPVTCLVIGTVVFVKRRR